MDDPKPGDLAEVWYNPKGTTFSWSDVYKEFNTRISFPILKVSEDELEISLEGSPCAGFGGKYTIPKYKKWLLEGLKIIKAEKCRWCHDS